MENSQLLGTISICVSAVGLVIFLVFLCKYRKDPKHYFDTNPYRCLIFIALWLFALCECIYFFLIRDNGHKFVFTLELVGFIAAVFGAIESFRAVKKAEETSKRLEEASIITAGVETSFKDFFDKRLVKQLEKLTNNDKIYFILSSPAYGYGVVGKEKFQRFKQNISNLNCSVEIMFFDPDAHFNYWCNVLLWAKEKNQRGGFFANDFANEIESILDILLTKKNVYDNKWRIWLTKDTTVRLVAFSTNSDKDTKNAHVLLTDQFSIPVDQSNEGFKIHGIPILIGHIEEYIGDDGYFNRIKKCPYTLKDREEAEVDKNYLKCLALDYMLGRTTKKQFEDFQLFKSEFEQLLKNMNKDNKQTNNVIVLSILNVVIKYFNDILSKHHTNASSMQAARIEYGITNIPDNIRSDEHSNQISEVLSNESINGFKQILGKIDIHDDDRAKAKGEFANISCDNKLIISIYAIITSGFGESGYAKEVRKVMNSTAG